MELIRTWLLGVTAAALAVALAQALTPEGTVKKIGKLAGGLVLLLAAWKPLVGLPGVSVAVADWGLREVEAGTVGEGTLKSLIQEKTTAYIVDKGAQLGCQVTADVLVKEDENGWMTPWSVEVAGTWTSAQRRALSGTLAADLNIPPQRQSFREEP